MATKQNNTYHSSGSVNTSSPKTGGSYNATRNGQKPAYNPQSNSVQKNANNSRKNSFHRQSNVSRIQDENDNPNHEQLEESEKIKKAAAKKTISEAAKAYNPVVGVAVEKALETPKGEEYLDEFAKASSVSEGVQKVVKKANQEKKKKKMILGAFLAFGPFLFFLMIVGAVLGKNADSQEISHDINYWQDDLSEETGFADDDTGLDILEDDDTDSNVFKNYPGMYQTVSEAVRDVSRERDKEVVVDKYLILATLIAPIENGLIQPVERERCDGSSKQPEGDIKYCYPARDDDGNVKYYNYDDFIKVWASQAKLLSNMQIMTYSNLDGDTVANKQRDNIKCDPADSMEQIAKNDRKVEKFGIGNIFAFWTWGHDFADRVTAEVNIRCIKAPIGTSKIPDVRVLSIDQGTYYLQPDGKTYEKDPKSGGVYFWNLVNKNGFIDSYFRDYLSYDNENDDENYENNLPKILEIANYIYSYYESIRLDCEGYKVMDQKIDKIKFREDKNSKIYTLDFEDVFVGGSVLATYQGATGEVAKAQAVITRSEAYNAVVEEGMDVIVGTAKMGCWWHKYNPTYDPSYEDQDDNPNYDPDYPKRVYSEIYKAVTETRGLVVTNFGSYKVLPTEYDAFCPQTREPVGDFYYLPDGQRDLPISTGKFSVSEKLVECPCFKNKDSMPKDQFVETASEIYSRYLGTPSQTTTATCWDPNGETRFDDLFNVTLYGYKYHATGGHGRGVSQHGMAYFSQFGYKWDGLLGLFLDHNTSVQSTANIAYRRLSNTIEPGLCPYAKVYNR